jgi:hypothetical protein
MFPFPLYKLPPPALARQQWVATGIRELEREREREKKVGGW